MGTEVWEGSITISETLLLWPQRCSEWEESQPMPQFLHSAPTEHTLFLLVNGGLTPYPKLAQELLLILTLYFSSELVADDALNK